MILLHDVSSLDNIRAIASRIIRLFEADDMMLEEFGSHLTVSVGIAIHRQDGEELKELIRCADKAMYDAKKSGKNRYCFYHSSQDQPVIESVAQISPR